MIGPLVTAGRPWTQVIAAAVLGKVLTVTVILSTEHGLDPTGFGAPTGLNRLSAPPDGCFANPTYEDATVELTVAGYYKLEPGIIGIH